MVVALLLGTAPGPGLASETDILDAPEAELVNRTCLRCHNDKKQEGELNLAGFDLEHPEVDPATAERVIRKLRTGMMPPPPMRRPDPEVVAGLARFLETSVDRAADARPDPGRRTFQRLNRAEYARAVRDLLDLEIDVESLLPPDTMSHGFDNIADVQTLSPTLMESYLRAAERVSLASIGEAQSSPGEATYKVPRTASQAQHVPGTPYGSRGGLATRHTFPADGQYVFRITLHSTPTGQLFGATARNEQIEISVDGHRVALLDIDPLMDEADPAGMDIKTGSVTVKAGQRLLAAAFIPRFDGPVVDLLAPIEHTLADTQIGIGEGITTVPHLRALAVTGPFNAQGISETPSRQRVFTCRPTSAAEEIACAESILERLATRAYRRPLNESDLGSLMSFYEEGASRGGRGLGGFESGVAMALQAMLASPHFVFRFERVPPDALPAQNYRLGGLELASRLSFFLWGTGPDQELLDAAANGVLASDAGVVEQTRRMLGDPRAEALSTRFAAQWLRLQDLSRLHPDALAYPQFDQRLAESMRRESELLFDHLVRENGSLLDLLDADYTFVDERLARHYGLSGVTGPQFRRVAQTDANRRGLLGHAGILALTSHANRTSPVLRGKWVMEVLLGSPPPPPPPNVPELEANSDASKDGRLLTVRERLEEHRSNPACRSCHRIIDPIGLSLENFDVTGAWRLRDQGQPVDALGTLYDGTPLEGPADLRAALLRRSDVIATTFTEFLLSYAMGRRIDISDMPTVRRIAKAAEAHDYRLHSFILAVVQSPAFHSARAEGEPLPGTSENHPTTRTSTSAGDD